MLEGSEMLEKYIFNSLVAPSPKSRNSVYAPSAVAIPFRDQGSRVQFAFIVIDMCVFASWRLRFHGGHYSHVISPPLCHTSQPWAKCSVGSWVIVLILL